MDDKFWQKQAPEKPLFPDFTWKRPENLRDRGKVVIAGGNKLGFAGVTLAYNTAKAAGAAEIRLLLPEDLQKLVPKTVSEAIFLPSNPSGGFARTGQTEALAAAEWADLVILVGDMGQNSETALLWEAVLRQSSTKFMITRDAVDLLKTSGEALLNRPNTTLAVSFAQLQKLFQSVYYPKMLTFSQNLAQTVENLHKFTLTYPVTIELFHQDHLILAHGGQVISQAHANPMKMWTGQIPTKGAVFQIWSNDPLEALAASLV